MISSFSVPDRIEAAYRTSIFNLVKSWIPTKPRDSSFEYWLKELQAVSSRKAPAASAANVAQNMISSVNYVNLVDWRKAARNSAGGPMIHHQLKDNSSEVKFKGLVNQSAKYILDIPSDVATQLLKEIEDAKHKGIKSEQISQMIRLKFPKLVVNKIQLIARTGVNTTGSDFTKIRSEELGFPCFVWDAERDGRVRPSHKLMNEVICFWKELPSPERLLGVNDSLGIYAPGCCPNCRCFPRPILTLEDVFSKKVSVTKVYLNGNIEMISRSKFAQLSGIQTRIAA